MCLLLVSHIKLANPKLLLLPEELCIYFHRRVFFPVLTCSWPIIDTEKNLVGISFLLHGLLSELLAGCTALLWCGGSTVFLHMG